MKFFTFLSQFLNSLKNGKFLVGRTKKRDAQKSVSQSSIKVPYADIRARPLPPSASSQTVRRMPSD